MMGLAEIGLLSCLQNGGTRSKVANSNSKRKPPSKEMKKGNRHPLIKHQSLFYNIDVKQREILIFLKSQ